MPVEPLQVWATWDYEARGGAYDFVGSRKTLSAARRLAQHRCDMLHEPSDNVWITSYNAQEDTFVVVADDFRVSPWMRCSDDEFATECDVCSDPIAPGTVYMGRGYGAAEICMGCAGVIGAVVEDDEDATDG